MFALPSAVALAGCSLLGKYLKVLLGVRALRQQGSEEVLGTEGRGLIIHASKEGCCSSGREIGRRLRRLDMRAKIQTR